MIETNVLLQLGIALITNFANCVSIPQQQVPVSVLAVRGYEVDGDTWPVLSVLHKSGAVFEVSHGAVTYYRSPDSFSQYRGERDLPARLLGEPRLSTNQVLELADKTIRTLAHGKDPTLGRSPKINRLRLGSKGKETPFYEVSWQTDDPDETISCAWVEIDARSAQVVMLSLKGDYSLFDLGYAWEMRRRYTVGKAGRVGIREASTSHISGVESNQIERILSSWAWLCTNLAIDPCVCIKSPGIGDSSRSVYTNLWIGSNALVTRIAFSNGGWVESADGVAYCGFSSNTCYVNQWNVRAPEDWFPFEGKVACRWEDLATRLEHDLVEKVGLPGKILAGYGRQLRNTAAPTVGQTQLCRVLVNWTNGLPVKSEYRGGGYWLWEDHLGFSVEFDVAKCQITSIRFRDPKLIAALAKSWQAVSKE